MLSLKRIIPIIFSMLMLTSSLWASVEATYVPVSALYFYRSGDPGPYFMEADPNNFSAYHFVAQLGTLTFTSTDGKLFNPTMIAIDTNINFTFRGMMDQGREENSLFRLASAYRINNKEEWVRLDHGNFVNSLTSTSGNLNSSTFEVRIYLYSDQAASRYVPNATYTWVSGDFGGFNVQVRKNTNTNTYNYIPVNGQIIPPDGTTPPANPQPILFGGASVPPDSLPYGDPVYYTDYSFTILQNTDVFNIGSAYTQSVPIATANLKLERTDPKIQNYGVNVTFSGLKDTADSFNLQLQNTASTFTYLIPYTLTFGGEIVQHDQVYPWTMLDKINTNQKNIAVKIFDQAKAEKAPEGTYRDTITVTITPL